MAIPETDPFARAPRGAPEAPEPQDANQRLSKGMPSKKLRGFLVLGLGLGVAAYTLLPRDNKQLNKANDVAAEASQANARPGSMLVQDLKAQAEEQARLEAAKRAAAEEIARNNKPARSAQMDVTGTNPNATTGNGGANLSEMAEKAKIAAKERAEAIAASPMDANDVDIRTQQQDESPFAVLSRQTKLARESEDAATPKEPQPAAPRAYPTGGLTMAQFQPGGATGAANPRSSMDIAFRDMFSHDEDPGVTKPLKPRVGPTLFEGTLVRTVLDRGINTDLPGRIRGHVTSDVYDSVKQKKLIIPRGTVVLGEYSTGFVLGQSRVLVAMTRMILPNGSSISLLGTPAADMQGVSGMPAQVDNHFWKMFGSSLMVGAVSLLLPSQNQNVTIATTPGGTTQTGGTIAALSLQETIQTLAARNKNMRPTGTVDMGSEFILAIARDIVMGEQ